VIIVSKTKRVKATCEEDYREENITIFMPLADITFNPEANLQNPGPPPETICMLELYNPLVLPD
jgi:hypothetical protein